MFKIWSLADAFAEIVTFSPSNQKNSGSDGNSLVNDRPAEFKKTVVFASRSANN